MRSFSLVTIVVCAVCQTCWVEAQMTIDGSGITFPDSSQQGTAAPQYDRVIHVKCTYNYVTNGTALLDAMASITGSSGEFRYTIVLEPGFYNLQANSLVMKDGVSIVGYSPNRTRSATIYGTANPVVMLASSGGLANIGVYSQGTNSSAVQGNSEQSVELVNVWINHLGNSGVTPNAGLLLNDCDEVEIVNCSIMSSSYGDENIAFHNFDSSVRVNGTFFEARNASTKNTAARLRSVSGTAVMQAWSSEFLASGTGNEGIFVDYGDSIDIELYSCNVDANGGTALDAGGVLFKAIGARFDGSRTNDASTTLAHCVDGSFAPISAP